MDVNYYYCVIIIRTYSWMVVIVVPEAIFGRLSRFNLILLLIGNL